MLNRREAGLYGTWARLQTWSDGRQATSTCAPPMSRHPCRQRSCERGRCSMTPEESRRDEAARWLAQAALVRATMAADTMRPMEDLSRRTFLGATAMAASSYAQVKGAGERLRAGVIGCGGMANGHMRTLLRMKETDNVEIVAVCDLYRKRLDEAAKLTGGKPYKDYRSLLASKDIDYVLIATPEHWHA